jgi:hypothetical protein
VEQTGGVGWRYARPTPVAGEKSPAGAASRAQASHACSRAIPGARPGGTMTALRGARWTGTGCRSPRPRKRGPELVRSTLRQKWPPVERRKAWCPDRKGCRRVWSHTCGFVKAPFGAPLPLMVRGENTPPARPRRKQQGGFRAPVAYPSSSAVRDGYAGKIVERNTRSACSPRRSRKKKFARPYFFPRSASTLIGPPPTAAT